MSADIVEKFSSNLKDVLTKALTYVVQTKQAQVEPIHLLWALGTQKGSVGTEVLKKAGVKQVALRRLISKIPQTKKRVPTISDLMLSPNAKRMMEKAVLAASTHEQRYVGTEHLLFGMLQITDPDLQTFFEQEHINTKAAEKHINTLLKSASIFPELADRLVIEGSLAPQKDHTPLSPSDFLQDKSENEKGSATPALDYFGRDLTSEEEQKKIDPVIGRDEEIQRLMEILCRRTKSNPLLLGDPGVGKTAIVEGFAKRIVNGDVPPALQNRRVIALDLALIVAGTMYRGEFESRLKQITDEVRDNEELIIFIDELHTLIGAGSTSGSMDAANILKPALARGEIRCIGATTGEEFKKHIENDSALERRFQSVWVEEPTAEETIQILTGVARNYELFHGVKIHKEAIEHAVALSNRYLQDKYQPDKSLDLLDEASAAMRVKTKQPSESDKKRKLRKELQDIQTQKQQAVIEEDFTKAAKLTAREDQIILDLQKESTQNSKDAPIVKKKQIAELIARTTGIPLAHLIDDHSKLLTLDTELNAEILGQSHVVEEVAHALRRAKTGIAHPHRPLASFLFLGPSGVGKTQMAKVISEIVLHNAKNLIRLDMSEFSESFSLSKLIGSPAGYIGYRDSAKLTDQIKKRPYSVVLFDEIEKAHPDVQNVLLQILEEGEITDATGRVVNMKNTIIVLTSNIGLERFERGGLGFAHSAHAEETILHEDLRTELKQRLRPELLNRIDHLCVFRPLQRDVIAQIVHKELGQLHKRLQEKGIALSHTQEVAEWIADQIDLSTGAREVRKQIQKCVENKIAEKISKKQSVKQLHIKRKGATLCVIARKPA
jgi:ATP-dependent Clp protease ATP-binding subunit ClpC